MKPSSHYLQCHGFNIHYTAWGDASLPVVIAWHGLARTGSDFDALAEHLAAHYHVICPDTIGRGLSQWSAAPKDDYSFATYARITLDLMNALHIDKAHWIGTSMGGALGLVCAAALELPAFKGRIRSLVFNDIAPEISVAAVERIKAYVLLHKPAGYECSHKPSAWPSMYTLLPPPLRYRPQKSAVQGVQAVGRLDQDTTGREASPHAVQWMLKPWHCK